MTPHTVAIEQAHQFYNLFFRSASQTNSPASTTVRAIIYQICVARRAWQSCGTLCGDSAGRVRKHWRVRGRIGDLFLSDDHCVVRRQSQNFVSVLIATYFTFEAPLSGMSTNPARTFGSALHELLARALDLFHSSVDGHAGRQRGISTSPPGRRPILG
jgi:hypothetical protein